MQLDADLVRKAVENKIAIPLGLSVAEAALGIIRIINNMALAIRSNPVARGIDPREGRDRAGGAGHRRGRQPAEKRSELRAHRCGDLRPVGVGCSGSCCAGLLRDLQATGVEVLEAIAPDKLDRRRRGKNDNDDGAAHSHAAQLPLTAGDNRDRLKSKASFAALCGARPVPAASGKTVRHRLNRGGDRAANSAIHIIATGRRRLDPRSQDYVARRIAAALSKLEAIACLKRSIAREVFGIITRRQREINQSQIAA